MAFHASGQATDRIRGELQNGESFVLAGNLHLSDSQQAELEGLLARCSGGSRRGGGEFTPAAMDDLDKIVDLASCGGSRQRGLRSEFAGEVYRFNPRTQLFEHVPARHCFRKPRPHLRSFSLSKGRGSEPAWAYRLLTASCRHNGMIEMDSAIERGTRFHLEFPERCDAI